MATTLTASLGKGPCSWFLPGSPSLIPAFAFSCPAGSPLRSLGPSPGPGITPQPDLQGCPLPFHSAIPDKETRNRFALSPLHISPRSLRVPISWVTSCQSLCLSQAAGHQPHRGFRWERTVGTRGCRGHGSWELGLSEARLRRSQRLLLGQERGWTVRPSCLRPPLRFD